MKRSDDSRPRLRGAWQTLFAAGAFALCAGNAFGQFVLRQATTAGTGVSEVMTPCYALSATAGVVVPSCVYDTLTVAPT